MVFTDCIVSGLSRFVHLVCLFFAPVFVQFNAPVLLLHPLSSHTCPPQCNALEFCIFWNLG